jgi:hypothetical protein
MPSLAPLPKFRFFTSGGTGTPVRPLVGGKVYFYAAGTTTPKDTYTSSTGLVANTNPVILNSRGEADIWLGDGAYKMVVTDAAGVQQGGTVDNIQGMDALRALVTALSADLASTSDAAKGDALIGVKQPDANTVARTQHDKNAEQAWSFEDFGAKGDGSDDADAIQKALDWARQSGRDVEGNGHYTVGSTLLIEQYRTTPPSGSTDFTSYKARINQLTFTGTGPCIAANSTEASVEIKKLIGPGYGSGADGLQISGQGDGARHRVDWATGFQRGVHFGQAYSHTIDVGYVDNCNVGVLLENSNAVRIFGGRIGGQFSGGSTVTDVTTCDVGVDIAGGAANEIYATIEYCRHTSGSIGLRDNGVGNYFRGYIEGNNALNLQATGNGGRYDVLNGGNNNDSAAGYQVSGQDNRVRFLNQDGAIEETPSGGNSTMTFFRPTALMVEGVSHLESNDGIRTALQGAGTYRNELAATSDLTSGSWSQSALGAALWADVSSSTGSNGYAWGGLRLSTRFVFPARAAEGDIWRLAQTNRVTTAGAVCYGVFARVISGDVELMIRIIELANNKQIRTVSRIRPSAGYIRIGREYQKSTANASDVQFEISFRSRGGGTIDLMGAYLINQPGVHIPPTNRAAALRAIVAGKQIDGNMFPAGVIVNGPFQLQFSPLINGATAINEIEYPVYLITGGWTGNITLNVPAEDGARVVFKRDGVAAAGALNILGGAAIDGSVGATINMQAAWAKTELVWSAGLGSWLTV